MHKEDKNVAVIISYISISFLGALIMIQVPTTWKIRMAICSDAHDYIVRWTHKCYCVFLKAV